jgi:hypothetical protein
MKLKHIFENTPQQPKMTAQQVLAALEDFKFHNHPVEKTLEQSITIDGQGLIHIDSDLRSKKKIARMPLQLESVRNLHIIGLETLEDLPKHFSTYLELSRFRGSDLTSATGVTIGDRGHRGHLFLTVCPNLTTLEGIDNFKSDNGRKIKIVIQGCKKLAFDPFDYVNQYNFEFQDNVPPDMLLINAITLTSPDQINFGYLEDSDLEEIINKYRGQRADMISLGRELIANGYERHVRPT